jgi:hypothetical protein
MLDAILEPEWEYRYYSFNSRWSPGEMMASMRDGSGDGYFILFDKHGAAIKGFAHESIMSLWNAEPEVIWPGMYDAARRMARKSVFWEFAWNSHRFSFLL